MDLAHPEDEALQPTLDLRLELRTPPRDRRPTMRQRWQELLFLHWEVDAGPLQERLPPGLHVDLHEGRTYLGVVPFLMRAVRPRGLPQVPWISNFLECNVRTYVHDERGTPGVWFFSLDTDRWLAYQVARRVFHLPYFWARMRAVVGERVDFSVRRRGGDHAEARFDYARDGDSRTAEPGSLEFFLLERYLLFAGDGRRLLSGRVHHAPYRYAPAHLDAWSALPVVWNGMAMPEGAPVHACVAETVDVDVFGLESV